MVSATQLAEERVRRFERLGGVTLSGRELEDPLLAEVRTGVAEHNKGLFHFRCPVCRHVVRTNQEMEPMCTGPNWTNDHDPVVMESVPTDELKLALKGR